MAALAASIDCGVLVLHPERLRQQILRHGVLRIALHNHRQLADRLVGVANVQQHPGEAGAGFQVVRIDLDGLPECLLRFLLIEERVVRPAQVQRRLAVLGVRRQRLFEVLGGLAVVFLVSLVIELQALVEGSPTAALLRRRRIRILMLTVFSWPG